MKYIHSIRTALERLIIQKNAFILGEDVQNPYGGAFKVTQGLSVRYPENVMNMPMCEQGIVGAACGMALAGDYVIAEIMFGDFITLICDQMINHAAKFHDLYEEPLHLVVRTPSGGYRGYGATHSQSLERLLFGIPGLQVVAPNIFVDPGKLLEEAVLSGKPTLFVENKLDYSRTLLLEDTDIFHYETYGNNYPTAKLTVKNESPDWSIITYGGMASFAKEAAHTLLYDEEIITEIIAVSHLTEYGDIRDILKANNVLILEEGVRDFGWGSQIACELMDKPGIKIKRLGAKNRTIPCSKEDEVLVMPSDIINAILEG